MNPEAYLVGEIWHECPEWLAGDRFDAVMNYPLAEAILGFTAQGHLDERGRPGPPRVRRHRPPAGRGAFGAELERLMRLYDRP